MKKYTKWLSLFGAFIFILLTLLFVLSTTKTYAADFIIENECENKIIYNITHIDCKVNRNKPCPVAGGEVLAGESTNFTAGGNGVYLFNWWITGINKAKDHNAGMTIKENQVLKVNTCYPDEENGSYVLMTES